MPSPKSKEEELGLSEKTADSKTEYPLVQADIDLEVLIKAKYTLIYVVCWDESRVIDSLQRICNLEDVNLSGVQVWDSTKGLRTSEGAAVVGGEAFQTPEQILDHILKLAEENQGKIIKAKASRGPIFVLCDMFRYLSHEGLTPELERRLRMLSQALKRTNITVVITSPELQIPTALDRCMEILDYPLPSAEVLNVVVNECKEVLVARKRISEEAFSEPNDKVIRALLGLTINEAEDALAKSIIKHGRFDIKTLIGLKRQIIRKGQLLDYIYAENSVNDIGGFLGVKEFIQLRKNAFTDKALEYGLPAPKGIFMLGVQGSGKSLCAQAVANELQIPLLKLDMGRLFGSLMGESENNMKKAITLAESVAPCVLFIDEIDQALSGTMGASTDSGTTKRVIGSLLDWMQSKKSPVFIVACANSLNGLPAALLRKGRFDELFFVDLPNEQERQAIFEIHIRKRKRNPENYDIVKLVNQTSGFSGAEIESVVIDAMYGAFAKEKEFQTEDIERAIKVCVPLSTVMKEQLDALREESRNRMRPAGVPILTDEPKATRYDL